MKKGKLVLRHRYGQSTTTAFGSRKPSHVQAGRRHTETNRLCPERTYNLINLLSKTRAYAHEIAFTGCKPRDIHVGAPLSKSNRAVRTCRIAIWPVRGNGLNESSGSLTKRTLKNALDEKGKKYGSFNPESVNSFCPVAGG
jgi:hypothetical protein